LNASIRETSGVVVHFTTRIVDFKINVDQVNSLRVHALLIIISGWKLHQLLQVCLILSHRISSISSMNWCCIFSNTM